MKLRRLTAEQIEAIRLNLERANERQPIRWDVYLRDINALIGVLNSYIDACKEILPVLTEAQKQDLFKEPK